LGVFPCQTILMWAIAFVLLYLGIKKGYEPLLLIPIASGVLFANFPGAQMGIVDAKLIQLDEHHYMNLFEIDDAISLGMKKIDFLQNNYEWKERWFEAVPLFKFRK